MRQKTSIVHSGVRSWLLLLPPSLQWAVFPPPVSKTKVPIKALLFIKLLALLQ